MNKFNLQKLCDLVRIKYKEEYNDYLDEISKLHDLIPNISINEYNEYSKTVSYKTIETSTFELNRTISSRKAKND